MKKRNLEMQRENVEDFTKLPSPPKAWMIVINECFDLLVRKEAKYLDGIEEDKLRSEASDLIHELLRLGENAGIHILISTNFYHLPDDLVDHFNCRIVTGKVDQETSQKVLNNDGAYFLPARIRGRSYIQFSGEIGESFQTYFMPIGTLVNLAENRIP